MIDSNKRRVASLLIIFVLCLTVSGCGRQEQLENENQQLRKQIEDLTIQIEELKNGADNLIVEIRGLYEQKKFDEVLEKAKVLHEKHNGVPQDLEAQKLVNQIISQREEEERIRRAEAAKSKQDKLREIIRVKKVYIYDTNSAGKVDISINFINNSEKIIKYVDFSVVPYNAVGDAVRDHGKYDSEKSFRATGPFEKGQGLKSGLYWDGWYNSTIVSLKLTKIEIEYMDGSKVEIPNEDIQYILY